MHGIYKITNNLSQKSYIGQSKACGNRLDQHYSGHSNQLIDDIIQIEGKENFSFQLLKTVDNKEEMSYWEDYYIMKYNTYFPNGYNKRWNSNEKILNTIKIQLEQDLRKEISEKQNYQNYDYEDIKYIFNIKMFYIYVVLYFSATVDKDNNRILPNQSLYEKEVSKLLKTHISSQTVYKYLKVLREMGILQKTATITYIKDIHCIIQYINEADVELAKENVIFLWFIKEEIDRTKTNVFFPIHFNWVYSLNSLGSIRNSMQISNTKEHLEILQELGIIRTEKSVYKILINLY